jgi:RNA polymerase sigma-70 factor (ECF subfamily)
MAGASDRELIERAKGGDADAFGWLVRRHQRRIYRLAAHLTGSSAEAEDVMQEAFVRAYRALDRFDGRSEPFTWIYRIAVNLSLNRLRARKTRGVVHAEDDPRVASLLVETRPSLAVEPDASTDRRRTAAALVEAIDALSDTLRTTLLLVAVDGLSHEEAGAILGCPVGTVAWRVHEARRKLRAALAARGFGDDPA